MHPVSRICPALIMPCVIQASCVIGFAALVGQLFERPVLQVAVRPRLQAASEKRIDAKICPGGCY